MGVKEIVQIIIWLITIGGVVWKAAALAAKIKQNSEDIHDLKVQQTETEAKFDSLSNAISGIHVTLAEISTKLDMMMRIKIDAVDYYKDKNETDK